MIPTVAGFLTAFVTILVANSPLLHKVSYACAGKQFFGWNSQCVLKDPIIRQDGNSIGGVLAALIMTPVETLVANAAAACFVFINAYTPLEFSSSVFVDLLVAMNTILVAQIPQRVSSNSPYNRMPMCPSLTIETNF